MKYITTEYLFVTIPYDYAELYHKIMALLADYGEAKLQDCTPQCIEKNSIVLNCYNMFLAAIAARNLGNFSLANTLFTYVDATIANIYRGSYTATEFIYPPFEDGTVILDVASNELIDGSGTRYRIQEYTPQPHVIGIDYGPITITSFSYTPNPVPFNGNVANPSFDYQQTNVIHYSDNHTETTTLTKTNSLQDATVTYEINGEIRNSGIISNIPQNDSSREITIATAKVTIALPGTATPATSDTVTIKQAGNVIQLFDGQIDITEEELNDIIGGNITVLSYINSNNIAQFTIRRNYTLNTTYTKTISNSQKNYSIVVYLIKESGRKPQQFDDIGQRWADLSASEEALDTITTGSITYNNVSYNVFAYIKLAPGNQNIKFKITNN